MIEDDLQLLITLDDPWNVQECDAFNRQQTDQTRKFFPGQPDPDPTTEQRDQRGDTEQNHAQC